MGSIACPPAPPAWLLYFGLQADTHTHTHTICAALCRYYLFPGETLEALSRLHNTPPPTRRRSALPPQRPPTPARRPLSPPQDGYENAKDKASNLGDDIKVGGWLVGGWWLVGGDGARSAKRLGLICLDRVDRLGVGLVAASLGGCSRPPCTSFCPLVCILKPRAPALQLPTPLPAAEEGAERRRRHPGQVRGGQGGCQWVGG